MATVIFDFDNTLFESQSHKALMFDFLSSFGIPREDIAATYETLVSPRDRMYDMREHCELLMKKGFDCPIGKVDAFLKSSFEEYLMTGAEEVLSELKAL